MSQKLKLSISQPCHENWQQMNPTEQGKFCKACAKEVVDFTSMSDTQVLNHFIKGKKENTCGRLYNDQLNRDIVQPVYTANKISWYWNFFIMIFLLLCKGYAGKAQVQTKPPATEQPAKKDADKQLWLGVRTVATDAKLIIKGKVTDETGMPVTGATVQLKGTNKATVTDVNGRYNLTDVDKESCVLKISAVGYCTQEVKASCSGNQVCILKTVAMGEIVVVGLMRADYDDKPPTIPKHVAVIEVRDNITSQPVKAIITVDNNDRDKPETLTTNKNGIYKLRGIKERELYTITIAAEGYKDSVMNIEGWKFNERKEIRYVFLKRNITPAPEKRQIIMGGMRSDFKEPLYILDGVPATVEKIKNIKPEEIERINILKEAAALALYCSPASAGIIIITTKKQHIKKQTALALKNEKQKPAAKEIIPSSTIQDFIVAPNPVTKGTAFTISFTSILAGEYNLQILNASGALLQSKKIMVTQKLNALQLQTNAGWASGIYYISLNSINSAGMHSERFILE